MIGKERINQIKERYQFLAKELDNINQLSRKDIANLSKEYSNLNPIINKIQEYEYLVEQINSVKNIANDSNIEMQNMAEIELIELKEQYEKIQYDLQIMLLPKDKDDQKNAIIEIRAGTGGEEASLFASNLMNMYRQYAEINKWKFEIIEIKNTDLNGIKEVIIEISGNDVFSKLKFESGVHRVQRIPITESSGRIHTSAATVAVLPQAEEVDVIIHEKDLRIDVYRSSGAGGQHVNTTDSAVRITHIPTGIVVTQQDEKSQHKNKAKALTILRTRIYALKRQQYEEERAKERCSKIGSGDRSERIRTYNFPQSRVTDHRINLVIYELDSILNGSKLDIIINKLITEDQANILAGNK